jgi:uncharacterized protein
MNVFYIIIFVFCAFTLLFGAHYLFYFTTTRLFPSISYNQRTLLAIALSFLAISFILSAILFRMYDNVFTRSFYFFSGVWLGTILNLSMAIAIVWITIGIFSLFNRTANRPMIGMIMFFLALIFSALGVWNALNPRIKNMNVVIKNLPESWKGKKIVQITDLHLGGILREGYMRKVVKMINSENPDLVVITGDLLDGMDGELMKPAEPIKDIQSKHGIYYVTGNHETYLGIDNAMAILSGTGVRALNDEVVDINGLKLVGVSYPARGEKKDIPGTVESLLKPYSGQPIVLLYHSPVNIDRMASSGVNLELSGHTHDGQLFPVNFITDLIYHGYAHGLHEIGNYTLYSNSGTGAWGPTMRTSSVPEIASLKLE